VFYTYFDDKYDLLCEIIHDDIMDPTWKLYEALPGQRVKSAQQLILEQIYHTIFENKDFYSKVNSIENHVVLVRIVTEQLEAMNRKILVAPDVSEQERSYFAYFCGAAQAMLISRWIENGFDADPTTMAQFYKRWIMSYWAEITHFKPEWTH
jgi:AcrR family transcriptional regulator